MRTAITFKTVEHNNPSLWIFTGIISVSFLGLADYLTRSQIPLSFFYVVPIFLVTWMVNQDMGLLIASLSILAWLIVASAPDLSFSSPSIFLWNTVIHAGAFIFVTYLVAGVQRSHKEEQMAARTDFVTGVANTRYFNELLEREVERTRRYRQPITVVYIDIDNFKMVNDLFGHSVGDQMLRSIASELKSHLRSTDVIARLGGDEFAILLPCTHQTEAQIVISKVQSHLMNAMRLRNWPVTFSMGAVTYTLPPCCAKQLMDRADQLMYEVKKSTKNGIRFDTWTGERSTSPC